MYVHVRVGEVERCWGRWWMEGSQQALVLCSHTLGGRVRSYFFHLSIHSRLSIWMDQAPLFVNDYNDYSDYRDSDLDLDLD